MGELNVSLGTAVVMGLVQARMDALPTTAYLMLGGRCRMNCAFCAQARESHAKAHNLSRITWPPFDEDEVIARLAQAVAKGLFRRACFQVTVTDGYFQRTLELVKKVRAHCDVPVDAAILPKDISEVESLLQAGAEHVGFGFDAACERVFRKVKGGYWKRTMSLIEEAARRFPGRVAVHLIVGLGETEKEMVEAIQKMHDLGVTVGLFAFTPVPGTAMEKLPPPALSAYRRIQAARYLIVENLARAGDFSFSQDGAIAALAPSNWAELLASGEAFETSGCPDCNRPYYNEGPAGPLYNFPRPLTEEEAKQALVETGLLKGG